MVCEACKSGKSPAYCRVRPLPERPLQLANFIRRRRRRRWQLVKAFRVAMPVSESLRESDESTAVTVPACSLIIRVCHDFLVSVLVFLHLSRRPPPPLASDAKYLRAKMPNTGLRHRIGAAYDKVASFNVETLFVRKREPGPRRTVFVNEPLPDDYRDHKGRMKKEHVYKTNQVITSKYTVITFLPRNLLEQFRRIANMCVFIFSVLIYYLTPW